MATTTTLRPVPTSGSHEAVAAHRTWVAPAVAAAIGSAAAVATTWWIVASQSFELSMRTMGL
jgi:hypothetical protein